jgi:hypothetical protein
MLTRGVCHFLWEDNMPTGVYIRTEEYKKKMSIAKTKHFTCKVEDCGNKHRSKGYCLMHYTRLYKHGNPFMVKKFSGGENSYNWKGDDVGLSALHRWVCRYLGKPKLCAKCGTTTAKRYEWSNISGEYKRDLTDWQRLCVRCHRKYDGHDKKSVETRRKNKLKKDKEKII